MPTDDIPPAPHPLPGPSTEAEAKALITAGMAWMLANAPEKLESWLGQRPIGRVLSKAEQGTGYDPLQKVIHFPGGHPPEGTNLYAAPQPRPEEVQFIIKLRDELLAAARAEKIKPDILSPGMWAQLADLLSSY